MVENHYTRRATLKRLGAGLTSGILLSGGAAGAAAAAETRKEIVPPTGQASDWDIRWSGLPMPRLTSVADNGSRYWIKGGVDDASVGWTKYTSDNDHTLPYPGPDEWLQFYQTTDPSM